MGKLNLVMETIHKVAEMNKYRNGNSIAFMFIVGSPDNEFKQKEI